MLSLMLRCLGAFAVTLNDVVITGFPSDKIRAFLAYLALEKGQPLRRDALSALFWPELAPAAAQNNLRVTLHRLRETLQKAQPNLADALLVSNRQTVQLNPSLITVDVLTFQTLLATCATHAHPDLLGCAVCIARLAQAVELYRGELLAGLGLADAPAFEEWLLLQREMLHQQALAALHTLVQACEQQGNDLEAHRYASRRLALDPYQEEAHRLVMRILLRRGLRTEALAQYETCRRLLREQLQVAPDLETVALYEQIRDGRVSPPPSSLPPDKTAPQDQPYEPPAPNAAPPHTASSSAPPVGLSLQQAWSEAPETGKLYGRAAELAQLERWLVQTSCRLVGVLGLGGVGKTTVTAAAAHAVAAHFAVVVWRSLINASPLEELLRDLLPRVHQQPLLEIPAQLEAQLQLLLEALRQRRCLIILDNLESILDAEQPGQMRAGYTGYAQLLQRMTEHRHQSCLLFTSRERPQGMAPWEEDNPLVRTLALVGLDDSAGCALLHARGISGALAAATALVQRYSGNPLALKVVAQTVQELFGGDVAAFLAIETPVFDDIRTVFDQQLARLSPLERELLHWLAIEREPVNLPRLRDNLVQPPPPRALIESLRALQRRSLIQQNPHGFFLQNVVMEYLTDVLIEQACQEILEYAAPGRQFRLAAAAAGASKAQSPKLKAQILNRYALLKATANEAVRASQRRLIVQPLIARLASHLGKAGLVERLNDLLAALHAEATPIPGYAAGNLLNLLVYLDVDLRGYDFAQLTVRQAYLQGRLLHQVNFAGADLAHSVFTYVFGDIRALQFSATGQLLVAALVQDKLCLWRAADGQLLHAYQSFGADATLAAFSRTPTQLGQERLLLAIGHTDHQVRIWDIQEDADQKRLLHTFPHPERLWTLAFSPDGKWLASSNGSGEIFVWDLMRGQLYQRWSGHSTAVPALAFAPDGEQLASGDVDGTIHLWQIGALTPRATWRGHQAEVHALLFNHTGTLLVSGSHDRTILVWDATTLTRDEPVQTLTAHTREVLTLVLSPDGQTMASTGGDNFACLWQMSDTPGGIQLRQRLNQAGSTLYLAFGAGHEQQPPLLASGRSEIAVSLWDVEQGHCLEILQTYNNQLLGLDLSSDGQHLASVGRDSFVRLWPLAAVLNPASRAQPVERLLPGNSEWSRAVSFSPQLPTTQGATAVLLACAGKGPTIWVWEANSGRQLCTLHGHTDDVEALHFSPRSGRWLVSGSRDGSVRLWQVALPLDLNAPRLELLAALQGHSGRIYTCAFSPDEQWLATGSSDRTLRLWQICVNGQGQLRHTLTEHTNGVRAVAFSPNGQQLVSSGYDNRVLLWDAPHACLLRVLLTLETAILTIAFHPTGKLLALGANDNSIYIWDLAEERLVTRLLEHTNNVEGVRFTPDGAWLISAGADETIKVWAVAALLAGQPASWRTIIPAGPYAGMNITGVTGISAAQKAALRALGAVEESQ